VQRGGPRAPVPLEIVGEFGGVERGAHEDYADVGSPVFTLLEVSALVYFTKENQDGADF
jgi:hypothetical protein